MKSDRGVLLSVKDLAVAAVLVLAAIAFTSCGPSPATRDELSRGGSVTYPAICAVPLDASAKEAKRLNSILMGSEFIRRLERIQDAASQDQVVKPFLRGPKTWGRVPLPADLKRAMGGAELYVLRGKGRIHELVCVDESTLYRLPYELNQLMKDCGMRFSNADVHRWTPLVIMVSLACDHFSAKQSGENLGPEAEYTFDSIVRGQIPLTPSVALNKIVADTAGATDYKRSLYSVMPGFVSVVRADVRIDGRSSTVSIYTAGGSPQDDALYPVMFVHPAWNLFMRFSVPRLDAWKEEHQGFGMEKSIRPLRSELGEG
jgi:hypothetical protein